MRIKKKWLSGSVAGPMFDEKGKFTEQNKSLKEYRVTYKESEV